MLAFIEPSDLMFGIHPYPDNNLDEHEDDECDYRGIRDCDPDRDKLCKQL